MIHPSPTAMIAMSGGVDSAVAALLLQQEGFAVTGVTMKLFCDGDPIPAADGTTDDLTPDIRDARAVADRLGIPHLVCRLERTFCDRVVDDFVRTYLDGGTPNPCVICNKTIKFGALIDFARANGLEYAATGHYARICEQDGRYLIYRARDEKKDQSYMLWSLSQDVLSRVRFPLGELTKAEVREIAAAHGFASADRKDSQDICFLPDGNYADFIRRYAGHVPSPGKFVDRDGNILGDHPGMLHYTIGQRKGLGIALGRPMYVCGKNAGTGDVVLCDDEQLYRRTLTAKSVNFIPFDTLSAPMRVEAKIRYAHKAAPATVYPTGESTVRVEFDEPQRAIARGQSVVFYDGDLLVGGGIIE